RVVGQSERAQQVETGAAPGAIGRVVGKRAVADRPGDRAAVKSAATAVVGRVVAREAAVVDVQTGGSSIPKRRDGAPVPGAVAGERASRKRHCREGADGAAAPGVS